VLGGRAAPHQQGLTWQQLAFSESRRFTVHENVKFMMHGSVRFTVMFNVQPQLVVYSGQSLHCGLLNGQWCWWAGRWYCLLWWAGLGAGLALCVALQFLVDACCVGGIAAVDRL
jgi:hypothetical protein